MAEKKPPQPIPLPKRNIIFDSDEDSFLCKESLSEDDLSELGIRQKRWHADPGFEMLNLDD